MTRLVAHPRLEQLKELLNFDDDGFFYQYCNGYKQAEVDFKSREAAIQKMVKALEFYAGLWGEHQGSPIHAVNKFTQNRLNETRQTAIEALEAWKKFEK
jgi:hypothetical protein